VRLQGDHDVVLRPGLRGRGDGARADHGFPALADQPQPIRLHGGEVRTARDDGDLRLALGGQFRSHQPADRAGAEDANLHAAALRFTPGFTP
jgi:hypothetical protein